MLILKAGLAIIKAIRNTRYHFRLQNGTFGCVYNPLDCDYQPMLETTLESCPEYYKNESNRLQIRPEELFRHTTTKLEQYYYLAILAGLWLMHHALYQHFLFVKCCTYRNTTSETLVDRRE